MHKIPGVALDLLVKVLDVVVAEEGLEGGLAEVGEDVGLGDDGAGLLQDGDEHGAVGGVLGDPLDEGVEDEGGQDGGGVGVQEG